MTNKPLPNAEIHPISLAVRVFPDPPPKAERKLPKQPWKIPPLMLVFDTETRTDAAQALTFGSYRYLYEGDCVEEGIFCGDDLPRKDRQLIRRYVKKHRANVASGYPDNLHLLTREEFAMK